LTIFDDESDVFSNRLFSRRWAVFFGAISSKMTHRRGRVCGSSGEPVKGAFSGLPASASARPQRSEESQADGCPRPAIDGLGALRPEASPVSGLPELEPGLS